MKRKGGPDTLQIGKLRNFSGVPRIMKSDGKVIRSSRQRKRQGSRQKGLRETGWEEKWGGGKVGDLDCNKVITWRQEGSINSIKQASSQNQKHQGISN